MNAVRMTKQLILGLVKRLDHLARLSEKPKLSSRAYRPSPIRDETSFGRVRLPPNGKDHGDRLDG
jgi:hypothetical protein